MLQEYDLAGRVERCLTGAAAAAALLTVTCLHRTVTLTPVTVSLEVRVVFCISIVCDGEV